MNPRQQWPRGLRVMFWGVIASLTFSLLQFWHWIFVSREFSGYLTLQGSYAVVTGVLHLLVIAAGLRGQRRLFVLFAFSASIIHMFMTLHFSLQIYWELLPSWTAGDTPLPVFAPSDRFILLWNALAFSASAGVSYYLCRYEFARIPSE